MPTYKHKAINLLTNGGNEFTHNAATNHIHRYCNAKHVCNKTVTGNVESESTANIQLHHHSAVEQNSMSFVCKMSKMASCDNLATTMVNW